MNGNELDGLHWFFGMLWLFFMLWCAWFSILLSRRTKRLGEKEDENQRLREALQLSAPHTPLLESSKKPNRLVLPRGCPLVFHSTHASRAFTENKTDERRQPTTSNTYRIIFSPRKERGGSLTRPFL